MNAHQKAVQAYREILETMTMREIAAEMGWDYPMRSGYRKHELVRDAALILARREHPIVPAAGSAYCAEAAANR